MSFNGKTPLQTLRRPDEVRPSLGNVRGIVLQGMQEDMVVKKTMTDRELLHSCLNAMEVSQRDGCATDWRHLISALREHLSVEPDWIDAHGKRHRYKCGLNPDPAAVKHLVSHCTCDSE